MDYKIAFMDIDGTITQEDGNISLNTKKAIKDLTNKGIKVVAATGRPLSLCQDIKSLGIDTFITANGAYAKYNNQVIHKTLIDRKVAQEVLEFALEKKNGLSLFTEDFFMNGVKSSEISQVLRETLLLEEYPSTINRVYEQEIYLMCLYATDGLMKEYEERFPYLMFKRWHPFVLNVLQEEVSKSKAIVNVLEFFGFDKTEAIAIGDGDNDIDMLEHVGLGIAMGNGSPKLKAAADFVTKSSKDEGVGYALKSLGII